MPISRQLYELQEIDTEIEHVLQTLNTKNSQLGKRDTLDTARNRLAAARENLDGLNRQRRDAEAELDDTTSKITEAEKQLYGGRITNPKELSNLQHEINTLKNLNDQLETKALEIIDKVETAEKEVAALAAEFTALETAWQREQSRLADGIKQLNTDFTDLTDNRNRQVERIEPSAAELYHRLRKQKKQAVAKVEQGICGACRISLSASTLQKARGSQPVQCGSCGRIMFIS